LRNDFEYAIITTVEAATRKAMRRVRQESRALRGPERDAHASAGRRTRASASDRDLALKLGSLMLCTFASDGGAAIKAIDESGLNFPQIKVLVTLAGHEDEPASVKRIAEELGLSLASASRAVDALVKRDLATRVEDHEDRRVRNVSLTAEGQGIADELMAARLAGLEGFVATLSAAERRKLEGALEVLLQRDDVGTAYRTHRRRVSR
jgi:DNA-binding MarR family transcriptional regulator